MMMMMITVSAFKQSALRTARSLPCYRTAWLRWKSATFCYYRFWVTDTSSG